MPAIVPNVPAALQARARGACVNFTGATDVTAASGFANKVSIMAAVQLETKGFKECILALYTS